MIDFDQNFVCKFSDCLKEVGEFEFKFRKLRMTQSVLDLCKNTGPNTSVYFKLKDGVFEAYSTLHGDFNYYCKHPEEIFWEIKPHKEIPGYQPLKVNEISEIKKGDCVLRGDELYSIRSLSNIFGDYYEAPVTNLRKREEWGNFEGLMLDNFENKLYRKLK